MHLPSEIDSSASTDFARYPRGLDRPCRSIPIGSIHRMAVARALLAFRASWLRCVQVFADLLCEEIDDLAMTRNGGRLLRPSIDVNGVIAAFAKEFATVFFEMA